MRQFLHIYIYIYKGRVVHSLSIILEAITFLRYTIFTVTNGSSRLVARPSIDRGTGLEGRPLSARNPNKSSHPPVTIGECRFLPPSMRKNHLSPSNDRQMKWESGKRVIQRGSGERRGKKAKTVVGTKRKKERWSGRGGASSGPLHELEESYVRELINK